MPEPQPVTLRTVPAYRYREHLLCPTCAQAAILPITEGAEYDDTEHVLDVVAQDRGIDRTTATSDAFPTPIPAAEALNQTCGECEATLLEGDYWTLYHAALDARDGGLRVLDVGHFVLEEEMMRRFAERLAAELSVPVRFFAGSDPLEGERAPNVRAVDE